MAERIRLLFLLPSFAGGGAERAILTIARHLPAGRFQCGFLVLERKGPLLPLAEETGLPIIDLKKARLRGALVPLARTIRNERPDVVFSCIGYMNIGLLLIRRFTPSKTVHIIREANMPNESIEASGAGSFLKPLYRLLYPKADLIVVPASRLRDALVEDYKIKAEKIIRLFNPVDEQKIRLVAENGGALDGNARFHMVAAGRLCHQKGFDRLLSWLKDVPGDWRLDILGEGPDRGSLEEVIAQNALTDRVALCGFVNPPWRRYAEADLFVMPSRWEGLPNAALEALAAGTPVLATPESGGIEEIQSLSREGAVTVASAGSDFAAALRDCINRGRLPTAPRQSLLPGEFLPQSAVREIEAAIERVSK